MSIKATDLTGILNHRVDVEPGTTLGSIFSFVEADNQLKRFFSEYCSCDIGALHRATGVDTPLDIIAEFKVPVLADRAAQTDNLQIVGHTTADSLSIMWESWVALDERGIDRRLRIHASMFLTTRSDSSFGISLPRTYHSGMRNLEIILHDGVFIEDCDVEGESDWALEATREFTLFDVLTVIYSSFGSPSFDERFQAEVEDDEESIRRIKERFERGGSDFKPPESDDGEPEDGNDDQS